MPVHHPRGGSALRLEALEPRDAPATLLSPTKLTYQDADGDAVTVTLSKPVLTPANADTVFTFDTGAVDGSNAAPQQLRSINLTAVPAAAGTAVTVSATRSPATGGDGLAAVGQVDATGLDLGAVAIDGDLGRLTAGDADTATPAVRGLTAHSIGRYGTSTGAADLRTLVTGPLDFLRVRTDVREALVGVRGGADGRIGSVRLGGSLVGGATPGAGQVTAEGAIGPVQVGGDLVGGAGTGTGSVTGLGPVGAVTVGGSVRGGTGQDSGQIRGSGALGPVRVGGDVLGGAGPGSGAIASSGTLAGVTIGGSLVGGSGGPSVSGGASGSVRSTRDLGPVRVGGDVLGGAGDSSAAITAGALTPAPLAGVTVGGSVRGGAGAQSGSISATAAIGPVRIGRDLAGGAGDGSGALTGAGAVAGVTVGGSLVGGTAPGTGDIRAGGPLGPVAVRGSVVGGSATGTAGLTDTGFIFGQRIASVTIGGSLVAGTDATSGPFGNNGAIRARQDIGSVLIRGTVAGNLTNPAVLSAGGSAAPTATSDLAIGRLTVLGRVEFTLILAGVDELGTPVDADAQVGPVLVGGDWAASSLAAGAVRGPDGFFGTGDDAKMSGPGVKDDPNVPSRIASLTIGGQALGTAGRSDHYGIVAELVGPVRVNGTLFPTAPGPGNDDFPIGASGDFRVHEV